MSSGKLIVIEGLDGIGKTTQLEKLREHLEANGTKIATHHFPTYDSYQGKGVEKYLAGDYGNVDELSPYFINSLYAHDRAITWLTQLKPLYEKDHTILLDRYTTSSLVYQSMNISNPIEKRKFLDYVADFEYNKLGIHRPDAVILLEAPFELISQLRRNRKENEGISNDIHERDLKLLQKVHRNTIFVARYFNWIRINCATADSTAIRSIDDIHAEIYRKLQKSLGF